MPEKAKDLTALQVRRIDTAGRHPVGTVPGLYLLVRGENLNKTWVLRKMVDGKRRDIGLGGYPALGLADAIDKARGLDADIKNGKNPIADRKAARSEGMTFKDCADSYIASHRASWKNAKHGQQWVNTLATYVHPFIGDMRIAQVQTKDVLRILQPHWSTKNETMVRVRNRIELILSWAMAGGHREQGLNPAAWRGCVEHALPKPSKVNQRRHHPALPWQDLPAFMARLRGLDGMGPRCLEFTVLTACRSGESRGITWGEIDLDAAVWTVPGDRMKSGRQHRVPLSGHTLKLLQALPRFEWEELVFPGRKANMPLSDMTLTAITRRMGLAAVPHGFRSTFRDWAAETTNHPNEVCEMALAHAVGDDVEAAYRRGDLMAKRTVLMEDWGRYAGKTPAPAVVPILSNQSARKAG